jgi:DNA-binding Lrp family transcriptional regulator
MGKVRVSVLIQAVGRGILEASKEIEKIEGVKTVHVVVGTYDAIAYAELNSTNELRQLLDNIHKIEGITRTETCIAV